MTLVAAFVSPTTGHLVADMMVSSNRPATAPVDFPTMTIQAEEGKAGARDLHYVTGAASKLRVVPGRLAISCSGKEETCLDILENVVRIFDSRTPNFRNLDEEIRSMIDYEDINSIGVICVYVKEDGFGIYHLNGAERSFGQPPLKLVAIGSGADEFLRLLHNTSIFQELETFDYRRMSVSDAISNVAERTFLNLVESLRAREYWDGKPSPSLYGGWFDMALGKRSNNKLSLFRADKYAVLHIITDARTSPPTVHLHPCIFLNSYEADGLIVIRGHFDDNEAISFDRNHKVIYTQKLPYFGTQGQRVPENLRPISGAIRIECEAIIFHHRIIRSDDLFSTDWAHAVCDKDTYVRLDQNGLDMSLHPMIFKYALKIV